MNRALLFPRALASALPPPLRLVRRDEAGPSPLPGGRQGGGGFAALRHRNYRLYWFGQVVSLIGTWMQSVSQPWLVLELGGSPLQLGTVLALQFAPALLLAPLGGVLADRIDKRKVLIGTQFSAMVQAGILFALTVSGVVQIWHIYLLALLLGFINAVDMPVRQAFAAELVPREELVNAIALNSASFNAARVLGPAVAGVTLALFGAAVNFGINAVSYLAVLAGLLLMQSRLLHRLERPDRFPSVRSSLAEGVSYAAHTPMVLWPLVLLAGMSTFGMNFQTLLPLFARGTLALNPNGYGALFAAMGAGSLLGSLSLAFSGTRRALSPLIVGGGIGFVVFELLLGFTRLPIIAFGLVFVVGFFSMLMVNTINVAVQHGVSHALRGRVMSLYVTVFAGSAPIGGLFAGFVAQLGGAPAAFVLGATISSLFLAVVAWQLVVRGKGTLPSRAAVAPVAPPAPAGDRKVAGAK